MAGGLTGGVPALAGIIVLGGAAGSGKSTWAAAHVATSAILSSDDLRAMVGSGPGDLEASTAAFRLLDQILAVRADRRLATVVDTLGLDPDRRRRYLAVARAAGTPAVLVILDTPPEICRGRNRGRDRPVPADALTDQLRKVRALIESAADEGWDEVVVVRKSAGVEADPLRPAPDTTQQTPGTTKHAGGTWPRVVLQVSRFPWGEDPAGWLTDLALAAEAYGFAGLALMDHLIQIPQVDRAWEPIPQPWVTLGWLAGLPTKLQLGTLVSPITFHDPGVLAKTVATLDALSGGRAFCGLGAGWWLREHQAYGLDFPAARTRLDALEVGIETMRALWAPGTKAYHSQRVHLPETTCYPRPAHPIPIIVGGGGERRTLRIVAEQADGCNLPADEDTLPGKLAVLRRYCDEVGRDPAEVEITVLDVPVVGRDHDDVAARVERLRGRTPAPAFAARHHAGLAADHAERYRRLATDHGVGTVFVAVPDLVGGADLERLARVLSALPSAAAG